MCPSLWRCRKLSSQSSNIELLSFLLLYLEGKGGEEKKHTPHSTLPNSRKNGDFGDGLRSTWPRTENEELPPGRGSLSSATALPGVNGLQDRLTSLQTWNPLPQEQSKAEGAKFLPEGAKKATTWMNETGLRAPGAGLSLKSENEKSKIFFLTWEPVLRDRGPDNRTNTLWRRFYWARTVPGRPAEARRRRVGGGAGPERAAAAGPATRQLRDGGRGTRAGAGRWRVSSRGPSTGLPRAAPPPVPRPPARPPGGRVRGTPSRGRAHAASPGRPAPRAPSARTPAARSPRPRPPPAARGGRGGRGAAA